MSGPVDVTADAALVERLASLGLRLSETYDFGHPVAFLYSTPDVFIMSDMGAAGLVYQRSAEYMPRQVHPVNHIQLLSQAEKLFSLADFENLPKHFGMREYVTTMNLFGDQLVKWGYPRDFTGGAWALHCRIVLPPFDRPRQFRDVVKAYARLREAQVEPVVFYEVMAGVRDAKVLERAAARAVFEREHPNLHAQLVAALF